MISSYSYKENDIIKSFSKINLKKNDNLIVTTSLGMLGLINPKSNINEVFFRITKNYIGEHGTLFVPTYSYSFGDKKIFNVKKTKSSIGDFGNFVLKQKNIYRSEDPMTSIVGLGPKAEKILSIDKNTSYGRGCIFEKMLKIDLKILNIGLGPNWIPFIHYLDYLNKVPFRYDKYFKGQIVDKNNKKKNITWHYPVRNSDEESRANGHALGKLAEKKKFFISARLGRGRILVANYNKLFKFTKKITYKNKYLTSYYKKYWGFCLSYNQFKKLNKNKNYYACIQSSFKKGFMHVGEILIKGRLKKEILLSTNICHPSMGNNELSGLVTTMAIAKYLQSKKKLNYTYRILFLPETIGSISYINKNLENLRKNIIGGLNIVCTGDEGEFSFLPSKYQNSLFEKVALQTLKNNTKNVKKYSFLDRGSDERQYCSPGVNLPVCSIMRSKYGKYKEYHTSLDNLKFISAKGLGGSYKLIKLFLDKFESTKIFVSTKVCEPFLSKHNLQPTISDKRNFENKKLKLIKNILIYCDGKNDVLRISKLVKEKENTTNQVLKMLSKKKLIRQL